MIIFVQKMQTGRATIRVPPGGGGDEGPGGVRVHAAQVVGEGGGDASHNARGGIRGRRVIGETAILVTKPPSMSTKQGTSGRAVKLTTNYFRLINKPDWTLFQYRVDFAPDPERTMVKKRLFR